MGGVASAVGGAVSNAVSHPIQTIGGALTGGMVGGPIGSVLGGSGALGGIFGQTPPDPKSMVNSVDPRLQQMRDQQTQAAVDFKDNLPGYEQKQQNAATDTSRQRLAQQLAGVTQNSNARGMLYGSYNPGEQAQATAQNAAGLAQTKANINTNAQNTLSQLQNQALGTGVSINQTQQSQNDAAYQAALAQQMSNNQAFGSLLTGGGGLLGTAMGGGFR